MTSSRYSPVLVTVYNRLEHFKQCIASLRSNVGADKTALFVAIDAPYRDQDIEINRQVVEFAKGIKGFGSLELILRKENVGAVKNSFMAREEIFHKHSTLIRTEDDNLFSPYFLNYVNTGLNRFEDDSRIFAVCGYSEPLDLSRYLDTDAYLRRGFSSYGFGVWKHKICDVDWAAQNFYSDFVSPVQTGNFWKSVGENAYIGLLVAKRNKRTYGDMSIIYHVYKNGMYCVFPKASLVRNIGQDGSGLHSGVDQILQTQEIWSEIVRYPDVFRYIEPMEVRRCLNSYYRQPLKVILKYVPYYYFNFLKAKVFGQQMR